MHFKTVLILFLLAGISLRTFASNRLSGLMVRDCAPDRCVQMVLESAETLPDSSLFLSFDKAKVQVTSAGETFNFVAKSGYADFKNRFIMLYDVQAPALKKLRIQLSPRN